MTPLEGKRWKRQLERDIRRERKKTARQELLDLRAAVRQARADKRAATQDARAFCRRQSLIVRQKLKAERASILAKLRANHAAQRLAARSKCATDLEAARALKSKVEQARGKLEAERQFRREMRQIERTQKSREKEHRKASRAERRSESDDEVRSNIPASYLALWERVRRGIKGSDRETRTEAFLRYVEENPDELVTSLDDVTDRLVAELEKRERRSVQTFSSARRPPSSPRAAPTPAPVFVIVEDDGIPF